jgi:hypothetical protein
MIPTRGDWVRWITADFGREGKVIHVQPPSMIIRWLGIPEPQVFPLIAQHFGPSGDMVLIREPAKAAQIDHQIARGHMGVAAAAAALGITEKRVRQRLRSGTLEGKQEDGRWVTVALPDE